MKSGAKWGIGCGIGCLLALALMMFLVYTGVRFSAKKAREYQVIKAAEEEQFRQELRTRGFVDEVKAQSISIEEDITTPTIYDAQTFKLWGNCTTDLCVMAQVCEIYGTVEGQLIFHGQSLIIQPNAVVKGGLEVDAQTVRHRGEVLGEISGSYQVFED